MDIPSREKFLEQLESLATPIDFDALEKSGLVRKSSGRWYVVPNIHKLPKQVTQRITTAESGPNGIRVKFSGHEPFERLLRKYTR